MEEGRYGEIETFSVPSQPKTLRLIKEDMASPELFLGSSTNYTGNYIIPNTFTYSMRLFQAVIESNLVFLSITESNWV